MHSRVAAIGKFRANISSLREVWMFGRIMCLITLLPALMKFLSLSMLMKLLTPDDAKVETAGMRDKIVKYTDYILSRNVWIYRSTCLKRSLTLYHFLRKYGVNVQLCLGVRYRNQSTPSEKKELEGHAWLRHKGDIYLEKNIQETMNCKITCCFPDEHDHIRETDTSNIGKA